MAPCVPMLHCIPCATVVWVTASTNAGGGGGGGSGGGSVASLAQPHHHLHLWLSCLLSHKQTHKWSNRVEEGRQLGCRWRRLSLHPLDHLLLARILVPGRIRRIYLRYSSCLVRVLVPALQSTGMERRYFEVPVCIWLVRPYRHRTYIIHGMCQWHLTIRAQRRPAAPIPRYVYRRSMVHIGLFVFLTRSYL